MGQIQDGDFSIHYENDMAHVYHWPTQKTFIGKKYVDRLDSLAEALEEMQNKIDGDTKSVEEE